MFRWFSEKNEPWSTMFEMLHKKPERVTQVFPKGKHVVQRQGALSSPLHCTLPGREGIQTGRAAGLFWVLTKGSTRCLSIYEGLASPACLLSLSYLTSTKTEEKKGKEGEREGRKERGGRERKKERKETHHTPKAILYTLKFTKGTRKWSVS